MLGTDAFFSNEADLTTPTAHRAWELYQEELGDAAVHEWHLVSRDVQDEYLERARAALETPKP